MFRGSPVYSSFSLLPFLVRTPLKRPQNNSKRDQELLRFGVSIQGPIPSDRCEVRIWHSPLPELLPDRWDLMLQPPVTEIRPPSEWVAGDHLVLSFGGRDYRRDHCAVSLLEPWVLAGSLGEHGNWSR